MEEIIKHYLPAIIAGAAGFALVALVIFLLKTDGAIATAFGKTVTDFIETAKTKAGI